jgi:acyl dehydratase
VSIRIACPADLVDFAGRMLDRFADATGEHQWIDTDPQRAASGPFGGKRRACIAEAVVLYR